MKPTTSATVDSAGRLVVPKAIRERAGLRPGLRLSLTVRDGRVEIEPEPTPVRIMRKGSLSVAVPLIELPTLREEQVKAVRDALSRSRGED
jgi:AbrB family looped-hinge helix DNA binding protein